MGWIYVLCAAMFELVGVTGLKKLSEKRNIKNLSILILGFASSFALLYKAFQYLDISVAYAVWTGLGTAGAVFINMLLFGEAKTIKRVLSVGLIVIGVVGLKAVS